MTDLSKGRILVTGGAGFIGSALIWELNKRGLENILVADFLGSDEKWKNLAPLRFADYIEADNLLTRLAATSHLFSDIRMVFHLGANSSTTETNASYLIENNFEYSKALARFALDGGRRFVYASSAATYGASEESLPESTPLGNLRPLNLYGYSKHLFDSWAQRAGILPQITGLKYFNIFGPNEGHKGDMRSVVHKAFHQIRDTGQVSLFKSYRPNFQDGEQRRDFLYVKDAVAATVFLAERVDGGALFNIGSGRASTWLSLVSPIFSALSKPEKVNFIDMPDHLRDKYQYFTCADISRLRSFGFTQALTSLPDAVHDYVTNYLIPDLHLGEEAKPSK